MCGLFYLQFRIYRIIKTMTFLLVRISLFPNAFGLILSKFVDCEPHFGCSLSQITKETFIKFFGRKILIRNCINNIWMCLQKYLSLQVFASASSWSSTSWPSSSSSCSRGGVAGKKESGSSFSCRQPQCRQVWTLLTLILSRIIKCCYKFLPCSLPFLH